MTKCDRCQQQGQQQQGQQQQGQQQQGQQQPGQQQPGQQQPGQQQVITPACPRRRTPPPRPVNPPMSVMTSTPSDASDAVGQSPNFRIPETDNDDETFSTIQTVNISFLLSVYSFLHIYCFLCV